MAKTTAQTQGANVPTAETTTTTLGNTGLTTGAAVAIGVGVLALALIAGDDDDSTTTSSTSSSR